jgi:hypothetical protein
MWLASRRACEQVAPEREPGELRARPSHVRAGFRASFSLPGRVMERAQSRITRLNVTPRAAVGAVGAWRRGEARAVRPRPKP